VIKNIESIKRKILPVLKKHGIQKAAICGSFARGEESKDSDIDILVEISEDLSLFDFVELKLEIEKIVGREVDLIEYDTIKSAIKESLLEEEIAIL
jgi:predicted nucleotidyltransferase